MLLLLLSEGVIVSFKGPLIETVIWGILAEGLLNLLKQLKARNTVHFQLIYS